MAFQFRRKFNRSVGGKGKIVLPTRFLLGGNITDPLNLNSLSDDTINRLLNAPTPVASPATAPLAYPDPPIAVNRPINFSDPLNLSAGDMFVPSMGIQSGDRNGPTMPGSRRKKRRHFKKKLANIDMLENTRDAVRTERVRHNQDPLFIQVDVKNSTAIGDAGVVRDCRRSSALDKIVSPAIPQMSPRRRKRRRTSSEGRPDGLVSSAKRVAIEVDGNPHKISDVNEEIISDKKQSVCAQKLNFTASDSRSTRYKFKKDKFVHGNYSAYYGYRNAGAPVFEEARLECLPSGLFEGKDVLDVGCNVGHVTLKVAKDYMPRMITGIDIDGKLIAVAKKNIRHYMSDAEHVTGRLIIKSGNRLGNKSETSVACDGSDKSGDCERRLSNMGLAGECVSKKAKYDISELVASECAVIPCCGGENIEAPKRPFPTSMSLMFGPVASHSIAIRGIDRSSGIANVRGRFPHNIMFQAV